MADLDKLASETAFKIAAHWLRRPSAEDIAILRSAIDEYAKEITADRDTYKATVNAICRVLKEEDRGVALADVVAELVQDRDRLRRIVEELHPRVFRLIEKGRHFLVIGVHEPYYKQAYDLIRSREQETGTWTEGDEECYARAIVDWHNRKLAIHDGRRGREGRPAMKSTIMQLSEVADGEVTIRRQASNLYCVSATVEGVDLLCARETPEIAATVIVNLLAKNIQAKGGGR